jgi:hypothetical protein
MVQEYPAPNEDIALALYLHSTLAWLAMLHSMPIYTNCPITTQQENHMTESQHF